MARYTKYLSVTKIDIDKCIATLNILTCQKRR